MGYDRKVPALATDEEAEAFLEQDLSDLDFSQFEPGRLEFRPDDATVGADAGRDQEALARKA